MRNWGLTILEIILGDILKEARTWALGFKQQAKKNAKNKARNCWVTEIVSNEEGETSKKPKYDRKKNKVWNAAGEKKDQVRSRCLKRDNLKSI